jgi:hypothetical protein
MLCDLAVWLNHFEYHAERPRRVPDGLGDELRPEERRLIARSIATFQLGEQSDGVRLLRTVDRFTAAHDAPQLARITELLVREQQRHAALLRDFMDDHGIAPKHHDWTDWVFRRLRALSGLELCLSVLITAELIGNVYYRALETVTDCQRLKVLCRTLVADELAHVGFASQLLLGLRARRSMAGRAAVRLAHRLLFAAAAGVVFIMHHRVLGRAGFSLMSFLRACTTQYDFYLEAPSVTQSASMS